VAPARDNQRQRTRKDLLRAAARLLEDGSAPSMAAVADEAMVSRATAYRYFPSLDALLAEVPADRDVPEPEDLFRGDRSVDPVRRVMKAERTVHAATYGNIPQLRTSMAHAVRHAVKAGVPVRQNRRTPLIEAALEPVRDEMPAATYRKLCGALALVFGLESMIVFEDVLRIGEAEARRIKAWTIRALVAGALGETRP
jgi:AcrR family transcriptional regulator